MATIKVKRATTINDEVTEEPTTWDGDLFQMLKGVEITPEKSELNRLANTPKTDTVTQTEKPWYGFGVKDAINTYQDKVGITNGTNPFIGIAKTANIPLQGAMLASGMPSTQMLKSLGTLPGAITTGLGLGAGVLTSKVTGGIGNALLGEEGKKVGEVAPIIGGLTNGIRIGNNINHRNRFFYEHLNPFSYDNSVQRGKEVFKHIILDKTVPSIHNTNHPHLYDNLAGVDNITNRNLAFAKYLRIPNDEVNYNQLYIKNKDNSFSYNPNMYNSGAEYSLELNRLNELPNYTNVVAKDFLTGNGGNVLIKKLATKNGISDYTMEDRWDINPLKETLNSKWVDSKVTGEVNLGKIWEKATKYLPNGLKNPEMGIIMGGKPFMLKHNFKLKERNKDDYKQAVEQYDVELKKWRDSKDYTRSPVKPLPYSLD